MHARLTEEVEQMLVMPASVLYSFDIGIPSLVLDAIIVLLILRDPVWKVSAPA